MTKKQELEQLEQQLTLLLNKKSYVPIKKACTGKYRGFYDYGLKFQDGTQMFISCGRKRYEADLRDLVAQYTYFREKHVWLEEQVRLIVERDNRQAVALGLEPIKFIHLELIEAETGGYEFWPRIVLERKGRQFTKLETMLKYACLGHKTVEYFSKMQIRPDKKLGNIKEQEHKGYNAIVLGYLCTVVIGRVFYKGDNIPLTPAQLAKEAGPRLFESDFPERVSGHGHCDCEDGGDFELLPSDDPAVVEGGKRYMQCRICGGCSHL